MGIKDPNRIFDPFYTTKRVGKGTGLGLSICYGIIKEHGGDITAHNRPEGGAAIEVRLPASGHVVADRDQFGASRRELAIEGRVLLVEDEEAVLEFERDVLVGAGAQVVTALTNDEAKTRSYGSETFDAVIMNGRMPGGWAAPDAHRWIGAACPGLEKKVHVYVLDHGGQRRPHLSAAGAHSFAGEAVRGGGTDLACAAVVAEGAGCGR